MEISRKELAESIYDWLKAGMTLTEAIERMLEQHEKDVLKKAESRINTFKAVARCCYPDCECPFDSPGGDWCALGLKRIKEKT